jgi:hypothetical protein
MVAFMDGRAFLNILNTLVIGTTVTVTVAIPFGLIGYSVIRKNFGIDCLILKKIIRKPIEGGKLIERIELELLT